MTVLTRKRLETHFLPWSTWFDPYWLGGLGFDRKWRFWPENGPKLIFYPGRHGLTRIDSVDSVLTRNGLKLIFYSGRHVLTCIDSVDSVLTRKLIFYLADMVWPVLTRWNRFLWKDAVDSRKIYFWIFLFLNFFGIFINNNRNKITFEKITVDPKLGYNTEPKLIWVYMTNQEFG